MEYARTLLSRAVVSTDSEAYEVSEALNYLGLYEEAKSVLVTRGMHWMRYYAPMTRSADSDDNPTGTGSRHNLMRIKAFTLFLHAKDFRRCRELLDESLSRCILGVTTSSAFGDLRIHNYPKYSSLAPFQQIGDDKTTPNSVDLVVDLAIELDIGEEILSMINSEVDLYNLRRGPVFILGTYCDLIKSLLSIEELRHALSVNIGIRKNGTPHHHHHRHYSSNSNSPPVIGDGLSDDEMEVQESSLGNADVGNADVAGMERYISVMEKCGTLLTQLILPSVEEDSKGMPERYCYTVTKL